MAVSKFTEEQITFALREVEGRRPVADVCRQMTGSLFFMADGTAGL